VLRFSRTLAPGARETEQSRALLSLSLSLSLSLLSVRAERRTPSRRARAKQFSRMHGTKTSEKSWMTPPSGIAKRVRSRSANEMETYKG